MSNNEADVSTSCCENMENLSSVLVKWRQGQVELYIGVVFEPIHPFLSRSGCNPETEAPSLTALVFALLQNLIKNSHHARSITVAVEEK